MGLLHSWHPKCSSIEQALSLLGCGSTEVMPGELGGIQPASQGDPFEPLSHCQTAALSIKHRVVVAVTVLFSGKQQGARDHFPLRSLIRPVKLLDA